MPDISTYKKRWRDWRRMAWIKEQPCCAGLDPVVLELAGNCEGVIECDHGGGAGMGRKNLDESGCLPLCSRHHRSPGLEHLLFGLVEHGFVRTWKRGQAEAYRLAYDQQFVGGRWEDS